MSASEKPNDSTNKKTGFDKKIKEPQDQNGVLTSKAVTEKKHHNDNEVQVLS